MAKTYIDVEFGTPVNGVLASLSTALTGTNNDITFTSKLPGAAGNNIAISYTKPDKANAELGLTVTTTELGNGVYSYLIDVSLATDASKNITTKASDIVALVNGHPQAKKLVFAENKGEDTGAGVVTTLLAANGKLANGVAGTVAKGNALMTDGTNLYVCVSPDGNSTVGANWKKIQLASL